MKILVNNEETDFQGKSIADLIVSMSLSMQGCAIAIGTKIIPASKWEEYILQEGDNVTIIRATQGG
ncbi:MAG TPA: sulfur carrier protein ThiS [Candidatus Avirikenella pullistercoris]|nr:sulfur carrier protein ThiS [Candidatus Avirikenella pullistercoris]